MKGMRSVVPHGVYSRIRTPSGLNVRGTQTLNSVIKNADQHEKEPPMIYCRARQVIFPFHIGDPRLPVTSRVSENEAWKQQLAWCKTERDILNQFNVEADGFNSASCATVVVQLLEKERKHKGFHYTIASLVQPKLLESMYQTIVSDHSSISNDLLLELFFACVQSEEERDRHLFPDLTALISLRMSTFTLENCISLSECLCEQLRVIQDDETVDATERTRYKDLLELLWKQIADNQGVLLNQENVCLVYERMPVEVKYLMRNFYTSLKKWCHTLSMEEILKILKAMRVLNVSHIESGEILGMWFLTSSVGQSSGKLLELIDYYIYFKIINLDVFLKLHKVVSATTDPRLLGAIVEYCYECAALQQNIPQGLLTNFFLVSQNVFLQNIWSLTVSEFHRLYTSLGKLVIIQNNQTTEPSKLGIHGSPTLEPLNLNLLIAARRYIKKNFVTFPVCKRTELLSVHSGVMERVPHNFMKDMINLDYVDDIAALEDPREIFQTLYHYNMVVMQLLEEGDVDTVEDTNVVDVSQEQTSPEGKSSLSRLSKDFPFFNHIMTNYLATDKWREDVRLLLDKNVEVFLKVEPLVKEVVGHYAMNYREMDICPFRIPFVVHRNKNGEVVPVSDVLQPETSKLALLLKPVSGVHLPAFCLYEHVLEKRFLQSRGYECIEFQVDQIFSEQNKQDLQKKLETWKSDGMIKGIRHSDEML